LPGTVRASNRPTYIRHLGLRLPSRRDRAYRELGLTGAEVEEKLIALMSSHPTLLERPIGMVGNRAVVGRPPERLLTLLDD
jgi:arsenate reductase